MIMDKKKKFEVIEESRFLENREMAKANGGACPDVITCGPDSQYSTCAISQESCPIFGGQECVWYQMVCTPITTQRYSSCTEGEGLLVCDGIYTFPS